MTKRLLFPVCIILLLSSAWSELPSELPGEEITNEYLNYAIPKDTLKDTTTTQDNTQPVWYDKVCKTWDAPKFSEQFSSDASNIPIGKGGIFIPRYTEAANEPDLEIVDPDGHTVTSGRPGQAYGVEPGTYYVMLGSGSHRQRIVRKVLVEESKTTPVFPDWAALSIETVDTNSNPFRGEYELVRIDEFEPYGRGFGADPTLGESIKTWVLKPGIYKILGRGESYNTLRNFVTVRLVPGELVKFLLIQREDNYTILGGGTVDVTPGTRITSNWKFGGNIGGTIQFSGGNDRKQEQQTVSSIMSIRSSAWLRYDNSPHEWETNIRLDEGFNISNLDLASLANGADDFRITSLYIWRILPWLGPYGRTELRTNLLPRWVNIDNYENKNEFTVIGNSNNIVSFDSSSTRQLSPSFSPLTFEIGAGANLDAISTHYFEAKIRAGAASSFSNFPGSYTTIDVDTSKLIADPKTKDRVKSSIALSYENPTRLFEFGPQASLNLNIRIGRIGIAGAEIKVFAPVAPEMRFTRPDFDVTSTLSWRLAPSVTLDYDFNYLLKQPKDPKQNIDKTSHALWLRFSYTSR
jgi:hypothetical protein